MQVGALGGCSFAPSSDSSAFSVRSSVWSASSVSSSIASSVSDDFRGSQEDATREQCYALAQIGQQRSLTNWKSGRDPLKDTSGGKLGPPSCAATTSVPVEERRHPRRSYSLKNYAPPPLQRQCERKINFVDNLVDCATQMVEVIWPLSAVACGSEPTGGRGPILPLRTYIEETLRRSRTSYSTLQVALYYLVLIKPFVPKGDFLQPQTADCAATQSLMCGRRMFLAALILASKYLQDRNYSAKAWSRMSGLRVEEVNGNERTFLEKVQWKLHISDSIFKRWSQVVLRYTPDRSPPSVGACAHLTTWKSIVPLLTPELEGVDGLLSPKSNYGVHIPTMPAPVWPGMSVSPPQPTLEALEIHAQKTPRPLDVLPRQPREPSKTDGQAPPTPGLARLGPLPTPLLPPSSVASNTPAVTVHGPHHPAMCSALAVAA